jgi:anti-sigma regulatory factor (Ser/Thr protein kinase)
MGSCPPYLFEVESGSITVESDVEAAVAILAVRGIWNRQMWRDTSMALRKCFVEHPAALIVDLSALDDRGGRSAPTWLAAQGVAAGMRPPVQLALGVPPDLVLADRLRRMGARRFLPVYPTVRQARVAIESRLPLTDRLPLSLAAVPESPGLARDLVGNACRAWQLTNLLLPARLVVSELVTNAVQHAGTGITVVVSHRGAGLHLAVADADRRLPRLPAPAALRLGSPLGEPGRGLRAVHATATVWGAMPTADGKVIWATIHPPAGSTT